MPFLPANEAEFLFQCDPYGSALEVLAWTGTERLSHPFRVTIDLVAPWSRTIEAEALLGKPAHLVVRRPDGGERVIHGIVSRFASGSRDVGPDRRAYRATLVPKLWLLGQVRRSRI